MDNKIIVDFAKKLGFDGANFFGNFKNYMVYMLYNNGDVTFTGYPVFVLYSDHELRVSSENETLKIMEITTTNTISEESL